MDADDDDPLGRPSAVSGGEQPAADTTAASHDQTDSHPTEENEQDRKPGGPAATAADVALEQDA